MGAQFRAVSYLPSSSSDTHICVDLDSNVMARFLLWPCQTPAGPVKEQGICPDLFNTPSTREAPVSPSHAASVWAASIPRGSGPVQETRVDSRVLLHQQLLPGCF